MEWILALTLLSSFIGTMINYSTQKKAQAEQEKHDREMAELNRVNQEKLMDYQNNLQQDTNMIATQKGHAAAAGYSPALLYGSSMPTASVSGGSASGSAGAINPLQLFDRLPIDSVTGTIFQQRKQEMDASRLASENAEREQNANYLAMKTAHEYYDTQVSKRLQNTIVDKAMADLENQKANTSYTRFLTEHGMKLEPGELAQQGVIRRETEAKIEKIQSDIRLNGFEAKHIMSDINRMSHLNELTDTQKLEVVESTKRSALGRVMNEFGLSNRITPAQFRSASALHQALNNEQMKGAYITLRNLGFSEHEASNTVLYYSASDPKDVTPSAVNAASRFFSALVLKK